MRKHWITGTFLLIFPIGGCVGIGPRVLDRDHIDYGRSISETQKRQVLLNLVRLRYADAPTFVSINQIVSNQSLQRTGTASAQLGSALPGSFGALTGDVQYRDNPTITFSPISGAELAGTLVRPLTPTELFSLAQNGLPIDVLLRLGVQSISLPNAGLLQNAHVTGSRRAGSPAFFKLLAGLRTLQDNGGLSFRFSSDKTGTRATDKKGPRATDNTDPRVYLSISNGSDPALTPVVAQVRSMLGMRTPEVELIYGRTTSRADQIAILTRSFIGVLAHISGEIDVPIDDVEAHQTISSISSAGYGPKPVIIVRTGQHEPSNAFATIQYQGQWFWVAKTDYDSKLAFSMVQLLFAIVQGDVDRSKAPVLTIGTGG